MFTTCDICAIAASFQKTRHFKHCFLNLHELRLSLSDTNFNKVADESNVYLKNNVPLIHKTSKSVKLTFNSQNANEMAFKMT